MNEIWLVLWPYIYWNYFLSKIVLSKIMKNLRVNYVLVAYFERKSNLVCQINCQGRYLHETMTLCIYTIRNLTFLKCVTSLLLFS